MTVDWPQVCVACVMVAMGLTSCSPERVEPDRAPDCISDTECPSKGACLSGVCSEGACALKPRANAACSDGDPCTVGDHCGAQGACLGGLPRVCSPPDDNPCVTSQCDPGNGEGPDSTCVTSPLPDFVREETPCGRWTCRSGRLEGGDDLSHCSSREVTAGGCVSHYVCDETVAEADLDFPCRAIPRTNGATCDGPLGVRWAAGEESTTEAFPSVCEPYLCFTQSLDKGGVCVLASVLSDEERASMVDVPGATAHVCSVEELSLVNDPRCQGFRCECSDDSCQTPVCVQTPTHDVGDACDDGNPCTQNVCESEIDGGLTCTLAGEVACDQFPKTSCDQWLACNPAAGGCPLVMLSDASHALCRAGNTCIVEDATFCDPASEWADPLTGCVTEYAEMGSQCSNGVIDDCVSDTRCLPDGDEKVSCLATGTLCTPSSQCQILVGCDTGCDYVSLSGVYCDDGIACTEESFCSQGVCIAEAGAPGACDDGDPCTSDVCDVVYGGCHHTALPGCSQALCSVSGEAGETVLCAIAVVRETGSTPPPVSGQMVFHFDPSVIHVSGIRLNACDAAGKCSLWELQTSPPEGAPPKYTLASVPTNLTDWKGIGEVIILPGIGLTPFATKVLAFAGPPPGFHTLEFDLQLLQPLGVEDTLPFGLLSARLVGVTGSELMGRPAEAGISICQRAPCSLTECGPTPLPDGCGGTMVCACQPPCAYHGCGKTGSLLKALRPAHSGDFNDDGVVNMSDVAAYRHRIWQSIQGTAPNDSQPFPDVCLDMDCDGIIGPLDLTRAHLVAIAEFQSNWSNLSDDTDQDGIHDRCDDDDDNLAAGVLCQYPSQACNQAQDLTTTLNTFVDSKEHCSVACQAEGANLPACLQACLASASGFSLPCAYCQIEHAICTSIHCDAACQAGYVSCKECLWTNCDGPYAECTGFELQCEDGLDNNGDGLADCLDPTCIVQSTCQAPPLPGPCDAFVENPQDVEAMFTQSLSCAKACLASSTFEDCLSTCVELIVGVSGNCGDCFYTLATCSLDQCGSDCEEAESPKCKGCVDAACGGNFQACSQLTPPSTGGCENAADAAAGFVAGAIASSTCQSICDWSPQDATCFSVCLTEATGLSSGCVDCYETWTECVGNICSAVCSESLTFACGDCASLFCGPMFEECSGLEATLPGAP